IIVYSDNRLLDPWLVSHSIIQNTTSLCPLVAVQPIYMHPYAVAKMVASLGHMHRRRIYLNMVAGGFKNDLVALNDTTPHDKRYDRLIEYTLIIRELLRGSAVSYEGTFYQVKNLKLTPSLPGDLFPGIFVSGSSDAGLVAFQNYKTMCPYLVGSYERVGDELSRYMSVGYRSFILDIPPTQEELHHTNQAFRRAVTLASG